MLLSAGATLHWRIGDMRGWVQQTLPLDKQSQLGISIQIVEIHPSCSVQHAVANNPLHAEFWVMGRYRICPPVTQNKNYGVAPPTPPRDNHGAEEKKYQHTIQHEVRFHCSKLTGYFDNQHLVTQLVTCTVSLYFSKCFRHAHAEKPPHPTMQCRMQD